MFCSWRHNLLILFVIAFSVNPSSFAGGVFERCAAGIVNTLVERSFFRSAGRVWSTPRLRNLTPFDSNDELFDLKPHFRWVREGLQIYLLEDHSQVLLYPRGDRVVARARIESGESIEVDVRLSDQERAAFAACSRVEEPDKLPVEHLRAIEALFESKICEMMFGRAEASIKDVDLENLQHLMGTGSTVWSLRAGDRNVGYQVEGFKTGMAGSVKASEEYPMGPRYWVISQLLVRNGVVELRAFRTDGSSGYRFRRFPFSQFLHQSGDLRKNLQLFSLTEFGKVVATGHPINGERFPHDHTRVSRARELGYDPEKGYEIFDFVGKAVYFRKGNFQGKVGVVLSQVDRTNQPGSANVELTVEVPGLPYPIEYPNTFLVYIDPILLAEGIDPVSREPFQFERGSNVVVKATGERGTVVSIDGRTGAGRNARYGVELPASESRPAPETKEYVTSELIPDRYFHPALLELPSGLPSESAVLQPPILE